MSAYEVAVRTMAEALAKPEGNQWRGAYGSIPRDPNAWHFESDSSCSYDTTTIARIALSALATDPDVRAMLVRAITSEDAQRWAEPDHEAGPAIRPWPLVDTILATLRPPEADRG